MNYMYHIMHHHLFIKNKTAYYNETLHTYTKIHIVFYVFEVQSSIFFRFTLKIRKHSATSNHKIINDTVGPALYLLH